MSISHRNPIAVGADDEIGIANALPIKGAKQFVRLFMLDFVFFTPNIRNHIIEDVQAANARITGAANRLHGDDKELGDLKVYMQRVQRTHQVGGGAVRIGRNKATPASVALL